MKGLLALIGLVKLAAKKRNPSKSIMVFKTSQGKRFRKTLIY